MFRGPAYPITSVGLVNCLGFETQSVWQRVLAGQSGLASSDLFEAYGCGDCPIGAVGLAPAEHLAAVRRPRQARLALMVLEQVATAVRRACQRWGCERVGLVLGTSTGGIAASEKAYAAYREQKAIPEDYSFEKQHAFDGAARLMASELGIAGPTYVVSTACSSSAKAAAAAGRLLQTGVCDAVLVGGVDSLCLTTLLGFQSLGVVARSPCRPFAKGRDGITIGEGAALLLLEREGPGDVFLVSVGETGDAHHMAHPHPDGEGAEQAMRHSLESAGLSPEHVDYINAHGTGTQLNDEIEAAAIRRTFGPNVSVSSTKAYTGHLLGACGATELVFCASAIESNTIPGNGLSEMDADLGIEVPSQATTRLVEVALSNSLAFGGSNASALLASRAGLERAPPKVRRAAGELSAELVQAWNFSQLEQTSVPSRSGLLSPRARGRASALTLMFVDLMDQLVAGGFDASHSPVVFGSAYGEMATTMQLLEQQAEQGHSSPLRFQLSVHNTAAGLLSIATGNRGFCNSIAAGTQTFAMALLEAIVYLQHAEAAEIAVVVADEASVSALSSRRHGPVAAAFHLRRPPRNATPETWLVSAPRSWTGDAGQSRQPYTSDAQLRENPVADALKLCQSFAERTPGMLVLGDRDAHEVGGESRWWVVDVGPSRL